MDIEPSSKPQNRAKLYLLDDENEWLDQGTGFPLIEQNAVKFLFKFFIKNHIFPRKNAFL